MFIYQWNHPYYIYLLIPLMFCMLCSIYNQVWKRRRVIEMKMHLEPEDLGKIPDTKSWKFYSYGVVIFALSTVALLLMPLSSPGTVFIIFFIADFAICLWLRYHLVHQYIKFLKGLEIEERNIKEFSLQNKIGSGNTQSRMLLIIMGLMILALMSPEGSEKTAKLKRTPMNVTFLLDLSRSMDAQDIHPSRLVAAKDEIKTILEQGAGDEAGLVYFTNTTVIQSPQTLDLLTLEGYLDLVNTSTLPVHGTDIKLALETALKTFVDDKSTKLTQDVSTKRVVLITDGENHSGDIDTVLNEYIKQHIHIDIIALGSEEGAEIPDGTGKSLLYNGKPVVSKLNEEKLWKLSAQTNGIYARYTAPEDAANKLLQEWDTIRIKTKPRGFISSLYRTQLYTWFLYIAWDLFIIYMFYPIIAALFAYRKKKKRSQFERDNAESHDANSLMGNHHNIDFHKKQDNGG